MKGDEAGSPRFAKRVRRSVVHVVKSSGSQSGSVVWQTGLSGDAAEVYERDLEALGIDRSEALRRGLRLRHREALELRMAQDVEAMYGGARAPLSEVTAALYEVPPPAQGDVDHRSRVDD